MSYKMLKKETKFITFEKYIGYFKDVKRIESVINEYPCTFDEAKNV